MSESTIWHESRRSLTGTLDVLFYPYRARRPVEC
jgi:hypothetical protein